MTRTYPPEPPSEPLFLVPWPVPAFAGFFLIIHIALQLAPVAWKGAAYFYLALVPARFLVDDPTFQAVAFANLITHGFLHYDWMHVLVNVALLLAAAGPVMRNCGALRTWLLFLICVAAGGILHVAVYWGAGESVIGASGGAAGIIGAALRYRTRRLSQGEIVAPILRPPVLTFSIFWIGINGVLFLWDQVGGGAVSGYATIAHIGGYLAGIYLAPVFVRGTRPTTWPRRT